jgi:Cu/Ag efflux pump CusA
VLRLTLRFKWAALLVNLAVIPLTIPLILGIGSEFMPPLYEGSMLYMPTSPPGMSITEATRLLQVQDKLLRRCRRSSRSSAPSAAGTTPTDNTPMGMVNTTVVLEAAATVAAWNDVREAAAGDGRGAAVSRIPERLDAADSQPAGHAADRDQDAGGIKVLGADLNVIQGVGHRSSRSCNACPARAASTRSA